MSKKSVLILGGGVAGMTAAHELSKRPDLFDVTILDRRTDACGGKARTEPARNTSVGGRRPLPGEHGFRFFPGFYRHLDEVMSEIPFGDNARGVLDNLVTCEQGLFACQGKPARPMVAHFPNSLDSLIHTLRFGMEAPAMMRDLGLTSDDLGFYFGRLFQVATSSEARRFGEYERTGWWDFIDAEARSKEYQLFLATGVTRSAVATQAEKANTRTIGCIGLQLFYDMVTPGHSADRVLLGPTSEAWLNPWLTHLRSAGVRYEFGRTVTKLHFDGRQITGVNVAGLGKVTADYYVVALPVEVTARLLGDRIKSYDPMLGNLDTLMHHVNWMNGIQYYLQEDLTLTKGHINALDTPWALTALFQQQFWPWSDLSQYGDGSIRSILSVDISAWDVPGTTDGPCGGRPAQECTADEVARETWHQLCRSLNTDQQRLPDGYASYWLDDDLERLGQGGRRPPFLGERRGKWFNLEPLLVNLTNSWTLRPESYTRLPNMFLAGDYVRTHTDFASMEGACEAGRRAANALFWAANVDERAPVYQLEEPAIFGPLKKWDEERYAQGLPWASPERAPLAIATRLDDAEDALRDGAKALSARISPVRLVTGLIQGVTKLLAPSVGAAFDEARDVIDWAAANGVEVPRGLWFCFQQWSDLAFLHWKVDPAALRPFVPAELELDLLGGNAWVTLVPMRMERLVLPVGDPPGADRFAQLNLRTYVRYGTIQGVYFIRIDADDVLASWAARFFTDTNYQASEAMSHSVVGDGLDFSCTRGGTGERFGVSVTSTGAAFVPSDNTIEAFLLNRDSSFALEGDDKDLARGRVVHPPWQVRRATCVINENHILRGMNLGIDPLRPDVVLTADTTRAVMWAFERVR